MDLKYNSNKYRCFPYIIGFLTLEFSKINCFYYMEMNKYNKYAEYSMKYTYLEINILLGYKINF